jgi:hypothetical protein
LRRIGSAEKLVRRGPLPHCPPPSLSPGSIFDRLNKQGIHNASFSELSTCSLMDGAYSVHSTPPHAHHDTHSDTHSVASGSTHRSAAIRRDSMLLRPTFSSAQKEKDHEDAAAAAATAGHSENTSVKSAPLRRNSLLLNPTASSRLKDLNANPLPAQSAPPPSSSSSSSS